MKSASLLLIQLQIFSGSESGCVIWQLLECSVLRSWWLSGVRCVNSSVPPNNLKVLCLMCFKEELSCLSKVVKL